MSHICPTKDCTILIRNDTILMCSRHWYELPKADRDAVYESFNKTGGGPEHIRNIQPILERQAARMDRGFRD